MSVLSRLKRYLRAPATASLPPPPPAGQIRVHFLAGDFDTAAEAEAYCFDSEGDAPEQITRDQPGAFIDTIFVEPVFGDIRTRLETILPAKTAARLFAKAKGANTLIVITEEAFGGMAYALEDTDRLRYLGPVLVDA